MTRNNFEDRDGANVAHPVKTAVHVAPQGSKAHINMKQTLTALTYCLMLFAHHHGHAWIDRVEHDARRVVIAHAAR